jgi:hypothetical protein
VVQKFDIERYNLKNLNDMKVKEQYKVNIWNAFAALENLENDEDVDSDLKQNKNMRGLYRGINEF